MGRLSQLALGGGASLLLSAGVLPLLGEGVAHAAGPDPEGTIYVADFEANAIDVFAPGSTGNVAPERVISRLEHRAVRSRRRQGELGR